MTVFDPIRAQWFERAGWRHLEWGIKGWITKRKRKATPMTSFDPIRAQRELVEGLDGIATVLHARARDAHRRVAEAEAEHNALVKLASYVIGEHSKATARLRELEAAAEAREKMGTPP